MIKNFQDLFSVTFENASNGLLQTIELTKEVFGSAKEATNFGIEATNTAISYLSDTTQFYMKEAMDGIMGSSADWSDDAICF